MPTDQTAPDTDTPASGLVSADGVTPLDHTDPVVVTPPLPVNDPNADLEGPVDPVSPNAFPTAVTPLDDVSGDGLVDSGYGLGGGSPTQAGPAPVSVPVTPEVNLLGQDMQTTGVTEPAAGAVATERTINAGWVHNELATLEAALSHGTEYVAGELRKLRQAVARHL